MNMRLFFKNEDIYLERYFYITKNLYKHVYVCMVILLI